MYHKPNHDQNHKPNYEQNHEQNHEQNNEPWHKPWDYMSVSLLDMSPIGDIYFIWCFDPYDMGPL